MTQETVNEQHPAPISDGGSWVYASEGPELIQHIFDSAVPALVRRSAVLLPAVVQAGCWDSTLERLYIVSSNGGYAANFAPSDEHFLSAFEITSTGALNQIGETVSLPHRPVDVTIDHANSHVLVAYSEPAGITIHLVLDDGTIGEDRESPRLELRNYSHQIMVSPGDDFVAICCTGQIIDRNADPSQFRGAIHAFSYENGRIGDVLRAPLPDGGLRFSPRDLEFHPTLPLAYVSLERHHELHVYRYDSTGLETEPLYRTTTLAGEPSKAMQFTGTVRMHPSGRVVYVANRTLGAYEEGDRKRLAKGGDTVAVFGIDPQSGRPTLLQNIDSEGVMPRTMAIDPSGEFLIVANQFEIEAFDGDLLRRVPQSLMVFRIAPDGRLTRAARHELELGSKPMIWMDLLPASKLQR